MDDYPFLAGKSGTPQRFIGFDINRHNDLQDDPFAIQVFTTSPTYGNQQLVFTQDGFFGLLMDDGAVTKLGLTAFILDQGLVTNFATFSIQNVIYAPEPATVLLVLGGAAILVWCRRYMP